MSSESLKFSVSPACPEDAAVLTRVAHAAKSHWGYPDRWMTLWRGQLTIQAHDIAAQPAFVARAGDQLLGFCAVSRRGDLATLEHLWVLPEAMGCGVGRALFEQAAGFARQQGATALEVESDPHATGFYRRMGCQLVGETVYDLDGQPRRLPLLRLALQTEAVAAR